MKVCDLRPFTSQVTPQDPPTSHSIELLKQEIEAYLRQLREAMCDDLQDLQAQIDVHETRIDACCGSI